MSFPKLFSVIIIISSTCVLINAAGPDPWDSMKVKAPLERKKDFEFGTPKIKSEDKLEDCQLGDIFYKKIIKTIIANGNFVEGFSSAQGGVFFKFSNSELAQIKELMLSTGCLSASDYRTLDGLFSNNISHISQRALITDLVTVIAERIFTAFTTYYIYGVLVLVGLLALKVSASHGIPWRLLFVVFVIFCFVWESHKALAEADEMEELRFLDSIRQCSSWFSFFTCEPFKKSVVHYYHHLHPLKITTSLLNKTILSPIVALLDLVDKAATKISEKFFYWSGLQPVIYTLVMVVFYIFFIGLIILLLVTFFCVVVFNVPISMSSWFFKVNVHQRDTSESITRNNAPVNESRTNQPLPSCNEDRISGENLKQFMSIINDIAKSNPSRAVTPAVFVDEPDSEERLCIKDGSESEELPNDQSTPKKTKKRRSNKENTSPEATNEADNLLSEDFEVRHRRVSSTLKKMEKLGKEEDS